MVRKPVREYANDYLYISENIFVQTEPHIHSGCRFPYLSSNVNPVNSTYHLPNLSTQYPQYQNQPLNSPPFFTIDQFPLTHKTKKSGSQNLSSDKPRLPETPCFLHFFAILFFDFWHQYYRLHMRWKFLLILNRETETFCKKVYTPLRGGIAFTPHDNLSVNFPKN